MPRAYSPCSATAARSMLGGPSTWHCSSCGKGISSSSTTSRTRSQDVRGSFRAQRCSRASASRMYRGSGGARSGLEISVRSGGTMKVLPVLAMLVTVVVRADGVPTVVTYVPRDKVSATMVSGGQIISDHGLIVLAQRRGAGEVEVHEKTNHVFIIVEGEATFVTGGTLVGARDTAPNQRRAPSVQGGEIHHLTKGDVITIPAKTPHWFKAGPTP